MIAKLLRPWTTTYRRFSQLIAVVALQILMNHIVVFCFKLFFELEEYTNGISFSRCWRAITPRAML